MKRLMILFISILALAGCGSNNTTPDLEDEVTIKLHGYSVMSVAFKDEFVDPGAYLVGASGYEIDVDGEVDINTSGTYFITYSVVYEGETLLVRRTVTVREEIIVEFFLLGEDYISIYLGDSYVDPGLYISDTAILVDVNDDVDMNSIGVYTINFSIVVYGETRTLTRTLEILDPSLLIVFSLQGDEVITLYVGDTFIDPGYFINKDDIVVEVVGTVDINTPGTYEITYSYTIDDETVTLTRTVHVLEGSL